MFSKPFLFKENKGDSESQLIKFIVRVTGLVHGTVRG